MEVVTSCGWSLNGATGWNLSPVGVVVEVRGGTRDPQRHEDLQGQDGSGGRYKWIASGRSKQ